MKISIFKRKDKNPLRDRVYGEILELTREQGNQLVTKMISEYYVRQNPATIAPDRSDQREFGVGDYETKIRFRHLEFKTHAELKNYLVEKAPPFISYSAGYYKHPSFRPMENKIWTGAELVFDLDATDMKLPCQKEHGTSWVCRICLDSVKNETIKLIEEFLIPDFGFSKGEIAINFSGNRGYHVHINRESVLTLDANARKEISDYIAGTGVTFDQFFREEEIGSGSRIKRLSGPKPADPGWSGKIAQGVIKDLELGVDHLVAQGINKATARNLYKKRALIEMGINNGNWDMVYIKDKEAFWTELIKAHAVAQSDKIDKNVTRDPMHLIRLHNTIHGETGLLAKQISASELTAFDPLSGAIVFSRERMKVKATTPKSLVMKGETFGPYQDYTVELPMYAALYLYLKGVAKIVQSGN